MCKSCGCHGPQLDKEVIKVEGMSCGNCKAAVEKAVRGLPGVLVAEVDLAAKTLTVQFDHHKSALKDIKQAVEETGFDVVE